MLYVLVLYCIYVFFIIVFGCREQTNNKFDALFGAWLGNLFFQNNFY